MGTGIRHYSNPLYDTLAGETGRKTGGEGEAHSYEGGRYAIDIEI